MSEIKITGVQHATCKYCRVANSIVIYFCKNLLFPKRYQERSIKFPLQKQSVNPKGVLQLLNEMGSGSRPFLAHNHC